MEVMKVPSRAAPAMVYTGSPNTDTRKGALSVPIISLTVREHQKLPNETTPAAADTSGAKKKKEVEGVFVVKDGMASFRPVKVGIAGDEYFEVLEGVKQGETIVAGSYQAIRDLKDSTRVKSSTPDTSKGKKS